MEPTLALCMIVRNEQAVLRQCLSSVARAVDAIYITDTGSTDGTLEIAREFGAQIRHFSWCDDFSAARNHSIQDVREDWLLILDADDLFPEGEAGKLRPWLGTAAGLALTVDYTVARGYTPAATRRIFRNHSGISFSGFIHENIRASLPKNGRVHTEDTHVPLMHTGYKEENVPAKLRRNLPLLEKEQARARICGDDLQRLVVGRELGWTWMQLGELERGERLLRDTLAAGWAADEEVEGYAVEVLATLHWHLCSQERYEEGLQICHELSERLAKVPAYWLYKGLIEFRAGRFAEALDSLNTFESRWQSGRRRTPVPEIYTGTALWDLQAQCCLSLGRGAQAEALFSKCLASGGDSQEYSVKMQLARRFSK